ncbi:hypothetical protein KY325_03675 [Candidatus Woesearchaeota archaeon]|nr:hypothetical protein [Candidatus Woesearchaeota archaeon]
MEIINRALNAVDECLDWYVRNNRIALPLATGFVGGGLSAVLDRCLLDGNSLSNLCTGVVAGVATAVGTGLANRLARKYIPSLQEKGYVSIDAKYHSRNAAENALLSLKEFVGKAPYLTKFDEEGAPGKSQIALVQKRDCKKPCYTIEATILGNLVEMQSNGLWKKLLDVLKCEEAWKHGFAQKVSDIGPYRAASLFI